MNILAYRMFFHRSFVGALKASDHSLTFFSSERRMDETGVIDSFYQSGREANLPDAVVYDVITRCRYLSGINMFDSRLKVRRMWAAVEDYLASAKADLIVSPPVDNYVTDIWFRLASEKGIPAFQPRRSPLPGLVRITNSTDNPVVREPGRDEIEDALARMNGSFKAEYQNTAIRGTTGIAIRAGREFAKKILFEYWKRKYSDPESFHYNAIFPNKNAITFKSLSQLWFHKQFVGTIDDVVRRRDDYRKVVFWPLAMAPESALCYLNADSAFSDYRDVVGKVLAGLPDDILLVVKEHPSAIGYRSLEHYEKLLSRPNVLMLNPAERTGRAIGISDAVLINTSSTTGLESVAVGKPVLAIGSCHYMVPGIVDGIERLSQVPQWASAIRYTALKERERERVLHRYLSGTIAHATWSLAGAGQGEYQSQLLRTLQQCVDLTQSGYMPRYQAYGQGEDSSPAKASMELVQ